MFFSKVQSHWAADSLVSVFHYLQIYLNKIGLYLQKKKKHKLNFPSPHAHTLCWHLPAAIRAALAKFPFSMQAISSLLSSTVFLRTKAGFPFPHFGRLSMVLETKQKATNMTKLCSKRNNWEQKCSFQCITWCFLEDCYMRRWRTPRHSVFVAPPAYWFYWVLQAPSPPLPSKNHLTGLREHRAES